MDIYQLDYILHEPEESEGWMYLPEHIKIRASGLVRERESGLL